MKYILQITLLIFTLFANGQTTKKVIYLDYDNTILSKEQYDSFEERVIYTKRTENDTAVIHKIFLRKKVAKLDSLQHFQINIYFERLFGKNFDKNKKTMIHLYRQNDEKIIIGSQLKKHWDYIKKYSKKYQAFLVGTKNSNIESNEKKHIYLDSNDLLNNLFFKDSDFSINHLFFKPNGVVYVYYGSDDLINIMDWSLD